MSVAKTRQRLVDTARRLFAKNGLEATTMNMIAEASQKGRRTLYTYFRNKDELYYAVIQTELERLSDRMDEVAAMDMEPGRKVVELIFTHLNTIKEAVVRNGTLRAEFFRNIWMVQKVRRQFDAAEREVFRGVLREGCAAGKFRVDDVGLTADIIHHALKGLEVPYICGRLGGGMREAASRPIVARLVGRALGVGLAGAGAPTTTTNKTI